MLKNIHSCNQTKVQRVTDTLNGGSLEITPKIPLSLFRLNKQTSI